MACILKRIEGSSDFEGPAGETVTIVTKDGPGAVRILKAEYAGKVLVEENQSVTSIQFEILPGEKTLKLVFTTVGGNGELHEDCGDGSSKRLRRVLASQPGQNLNITGK